MFDVVCVGSATQDVFIKSDLSKIIRVSDVLAEKDFLCYDYGSKVNIDHIEFLSGGGATNTGVSFARLGLKPAFLGKIGKNDDAGKKVIQELNRPSQEPLTPSPLTEREVEILQLLAKGVENKEIARLLFLREATVRTHVSNILGKLQLANRVQATLYA